MADHPRPCKTSCLKRDMSYNWRVLKQNTIMSAIYIIIYIYDYDLINYVCLIKKTGNLW